VCSCFKAEMYAVAISAHGFVEERPFMAV
jgi:hypothetical protein